MIRELCEYLSVDNGDVISLDIILTTNEQYSSSLMVLS